MKLIYNLPSITFSRPFYLLIAVIKWNFDSLGMGGENKAVQAKIWQWQFVFRVNSDTFYSSTFQAYFFTFFLWHSCIYVRTSDRPPPLSNKVQCCIWGKMKKKMPSELYDLLPSANSVTLGRCTLTAFVVHPSFSLSRVSARSAATPGTQHTPKPLYLTLYSGICVNSILSLSLNSYITCQHFYTFIQEAKREVPRLN